MSPQPLVASDGQMSITAYRQQGDYPKCSALGWSSDIGTPHVFTWTLDAPMFSIVHILFIILMTHLITVYYPRLSHLL